MVETKEYTMKDIEALTEDEVKSIADEVMAVKDHEVIFIDLGGYFGYSGLVFRNGRHIIYANEYELHWRYAGLTKAELRDKYIESFKAKLFTDDELMEPVKSYGEYSRKVNFLRNYWIMQYDRESGFFINTGRAEEIAEHEKAIAPYKYFSMISFCHMNDKEALDRQKEIYGHLESEHKRLMQDENYFRDAVAAELANHEACYTGEYEEGLASLGLKYEELESWQQDVVIKVLRDQEHRYWDRMGDD